MDIFSLLPPRLGGLDMLLPLFMEIKNLRLGTRINLIFVEDRVYSDLLRDPFLSSEVMRISNSIRRLRQPAKGRHNYPAAVSGVMLALVNILRAHRPVLLQGRGVETGLGEIFHKAVKVKNGYTYQHFNGLVLTINRKSGISVSAGSDGDAFLCFSKHDTKFLEGTGYRTVPIGYPRLYPRWIARVKDVAPKLLEEEYGKHGWYGHEKPLVLFLGSMVKELYPVDELKQWIQDVLATAEKMMPGTPILLKPHPVEKPHVLEMIENIVSQHRAARLTHLHPCVLAAGARLVVAHHSSTIIDSMGMGTPTIQYQELTAHWLKRHPEGSSFLELGPLWAQKPKELNERFSEALSDKYTVPDVRIPLKHKMDLSIFLG